MVMVSKLAFSIVLLEVLVVGCGTDDNDSATTTAESCSTDTSFDATYQLTFATTWDGTTHPASDFPSNPHFSPLVGATHKSTYVLWKDGGTANEAFQQMAETGATSKLQTEIESEIADQSACQLVLASSSISPSPGEVSVTFKTTTQYPLLSAVSMIAPSPDWFVGVSNVELYQDGSWQESISTDLFAWDGGTDSGTTYTAANAATDPKGTIAAITGTPFAANVKLGTITLTKQ